MSNQSSEQFPEIPFSILELRGIQSVISSYVPGLKRTPSSPEKHRRLRVIQRVEAKLAAQLAHNTVHLLLSREETQELHQALLTFIDLTKRMFPPGPERDQVIADVNTWHLRLISTVQSTAQEGDA